MSRRLFHGQLADEIAGEDRPRAERLRRLARELIGVVREGLIRDGQVRIHGFGTFRLSRTRARKGINPQTGERIDIPARNRVLFRPAKALRERIEPGWAPAVPLAEPHPSREALLGGVMSEAPAAGTLPAADEERPRPSYFPDRVAAAAMADTVVRVSEPASEYEPPASGSREANLGGTMGASPSAGRVPPASVAPDPESVAPYKEIGDRPAANEPEGRTAGDSEQPAGTEAGASDSGLPSREAALGDSAAVRAPSAGSLAPEDLPPDAQEPQRPGTVPATFHGPESVPAAEHEAGVELPRGASREAALGVTGVSTPAAGGLPADEEEATEESSGFDVDAPLRDDLDAGADRSDAEAGTPERKVIVDDSLAPEGAPEAEPEQREERPWGIALLLLLLLLLLLAPIAWWFWPRPDVPVATSGGEAVTAEAEPAAEPAATDEATDAATDAATEATGDAGTAAQAGAAEEAPEAAAQAGTAGAAGDEEAAAGDTETAAAAVEEPSADAATRETQAADAGQPVADEGAAAEATAAAEVAEPAAAPEPEAADTGETAAVAEAPASADASAAAAAEETVTAETDAAVDSGATEPAATTTVAEASGASGGTEPWFSGRAYAVQRGDTLWDLSDDRYVNPYYWPHIWNHNQDLANPDVIEIDQRLWLPKLEGEPRSLSANDRRSIAEGYLRLYRLWQDNGAGNPQYALVGVRYFDPSVMPPALRNDPSAGRPNDALAAAFAALLEAEFPRRQ